MPSKPGQCKGMQPVVPVAKEGPTPQAGAAHLPVPYRNGLLQTPTSETNTDTIPPWLNRYGTRMRGRWGAVVVMGLAGITLGGVWGHFALPLYYRSTALIELQPMLARSESTTAVALVNRHLMLLQNLDMVGFGKIKITAPSTTEALIQITVTSTDPTAAIASLRTLLDAYQQQPKIVVLFDQAQLLADTLQKQVELEQQLAELEPKIVATSHPLDSTPLEHSLIAAQDRLADSQSKLKATRTALKDLTILEARKAELEKAIQTLRMQKAIAKHPHKEHLERELEQLYQHMGTLSPTTAKQQIESRAMQNAHTPNQELMRTALVGNDSQPAVFSGEQLRQRQIALTGLEMRAKNELDALLRQKTHLRQLEAAAAATHHDLNAAQTMAKKIQAGMNGIVRPRIDLQPRAMFLGQQRRHRTILSALAGGVIGSGLIMLLGGIDQRIRRPDRRLLEQPAAPLFGTVPTISANSHDPADTARTALSLHEIRGLLELRAQHDAAQAFTITSPSHGSGKTSLTVGLASSLAISGTRTLLVDCELAGRIHESDPTGEPNNSAMSNGAQSLDRVMIDMGYLPAVDTDQFLLADSESTGLVGALNGAALDQCVVPTKIANLFMVPALSAKVEHIGKLSSRFIRRLVNEARNEYDIILFDTGPIPGSVEAMFVAAATDGVVLVVARGELQNQLERTLAHLRVIGANLIGTVFNRTEHRDLTVQLPDFPAPPTDPVTPPHQLPDTSRLAGSGIFAAVIETQAGPVVTTEKSGTPISAADAGDGLSELLRNPDNLTPPPALTTPQRPTLQDVLDQYVEATIESAESTRTPTAMLHDRPADQLTDQPDNQTKPVPDALG